MVAAATLALQAILPQPPAFVVHELNYEAGIVTQDRSIATNEVAFYAQWAVTVEDVETGASVRWCEGAGANAYPPGRRAVQFSLPDWTGRTLCTPESLPAGRYALRGSWRWGDHYTSVKSNVFEVVE